MIGDSDVAHAPPHVREIWDYFVREANHRPRRVAGVALRRGQLLRGYRRIQEDLHWFIGWRRVSYSKAQCETAMKWLKSHGMVTAQKTTRGMVVTVCNYDFYQTPSNYENHNATGRNTTTEPRIDDTMNKKDEKEEDNVPILFEPRGNAQKTPTYQTRRRRTITGLKLDWFITFWDAFDYKRGKAEAADAFLDVPGISEELVTQQIVPGARREAERRPDLLAAGRTPKMAQGWLTGRRWEDQETEPSVAGEEGESITDRIARRERERQEGVA